MYSCLSTIKAVIKDKNTSNRDKKHSCSMLKRCKISASSSSARRQHNLKCYSSHVKNVYFFIMQDQKKITSCFFQISCSPSPEGHSEDGKLKQVCVLQSTQSAVQWQPFVPAYSFEDICSCLFLTICLGLVHWFRANSSHLILLSFAQVNRLASEAWGNRQQTEHSLVEVS